MNWLDLFISIALLIASAVGYYVGWLARGIRDRFYNRSK